MNLIFIIIYFHWLEHFRFFFILTTFIIINLSLFLQSTNIFNIHSYILTDSTKYGFTESLSIFFFLHLFLLYKIILKVDKHSFFSFSLSLSLSFLVLIQYTIERMILPLSPDILVYRNERHNE